MVTNDQIRLPNKVQNRRNKQIYDTYAFTIDIVPLVLQDFYFAGLILEYNGIIVKMRNLESVKAESAQKNEEKAHVPCNSRLTTDVAVAQTN